MRGCGIRAALAVTGVVLLTVAFWPRGTEKETEVSPEYPARDSYTVNITPDYEASFIQAVRNRDRNAGEIAGEVIGRSYEDVLWLAKILAAESGPNWPDAFVMLIGEVVLNRVASPDWPNSIPAVLTDIKGGIQYAPVHGGTWDEVIPTEHQIRLAMRLLDGELVLGDKTVVYQALFEQGDQTVVFYYDSDLGTTTYFCAEYGEEG